MKIAATPITAAVAGAFSAAIWPLLWSRFGGDGAGSTELVVLTLLVIALPAHAFVVGFGAAGAAASRKIDTALLKRIGAWLAGAAVVTLIGFTI
jgi:hypothetical protein